MIDHFIKHGVVMPNPAAVFIGSDVKPWAIASGVILHPGARIEGAHTSIGPGCVIGSEGPATVVNCQLARKVTLGSGFFDASVFLDGSSMGGGAHVRPGCLIEEQASGAHTVGLKQTVLLPYVTLGSLINFCDCLMAGGTSRTNHSEVGSSYIHFNYTPHQEKATASLIGDVPRGVLLNQPPVFLGGQGGLVGPAMVAFGTVIPAGQIIRKDVASPHQLIIEHAPPPGAMEYHPAVYGKISRIVRNNLHYIGNIRALRVWYVAVRASFMRADPFDHAAHQGALLVLDMVLAERIKRLDELAGKMPASIELLARKHDERSQACLREQQKLQKNWPGIKEGLLAGSAVPAKAADALSGLANAAAPAGDYLKWVAALGQESQAQISRTLDTVVSATTSLWA